MKKHAKLLSALASVVFTTAVVLGTWPCLLIYHQPKIPEGMKHLRKS